MRRAHYTERTEKGETGRNGKEMATAAQCGTGTSHYRCKGSVMRQNNGSNVKSGPLFLVLSHTPLSDSISICLADRAGSLISRTFPARCRCNDGVEVSPVLSGWGAVKNTLLIRL